MCQITKNLDPGNVIYVLNMLIHDGKVVAYNPLAALRTLNHPVKITINGKWFGFTNDLNHVFTILKRAKRSGVIHPHTSISITPKK